MKTRCIIVDDEPLAIEAIQMHIEKFDSLKLIATCTDAIQAFDQLRNARIDLIFMDIQMPEMTGLEFLKSLKNPPKVIFTTAYREYAIQAFDLDLIDYLLKPISFDRFMQASVGRTSGRESTGLGLAITKTYLNLMGGSISVKSKLNVGSEFSFILPGVVIKNNVLVNDGMELGR